MRLLVLIVTCVLALGAAGAHGHPADVQDVDHDGYMNQEDNCPDAFNPSQSDIDKDTRYSAVPPVVPVDPTSPPPDTGGDACDTDDDSDRLDDTTDNCPKTANPDQVDSDRDGKGDPCDSDDDADLVVDEDDNCPLHANRRQSDADRDKLGDACDPDAPKAIGSSRRVRLRVTVPRNVRLEEIRYGITVRASCSTRCSLQGALGRSRAAGELAGKGWTWLFVRPDAATLRRVRGSGSATVTLRVVARASGGPRSSLSRKITIRR